MTHQHLNQEASVNGKDPWGNVSRSKVIACYLNYR